jgi:hypothetical protein
MLSFSEFFTACAGFWTTERTYHYLPGGELERSYTEYQVTALTPEESQQVLATGGGNALVVHVDCPDQMPGFAIAFDTRSETGETVSMQLRALFVPDGIVQSSQLVKPDVLPLAAQNVVSANGELVQGFYLRDEGYSEQGAIAGRFTYQPTRQTLEMTTYYRRSVAVDQMRLVAPDTRMRTIITYRRPAHDRQAPDEITLIGFGVERKRS